MRNPIRVLKVIQYPLFFGVIGAWIGCGGQHMPLGSSSSSGAGGAAVNAALVGKLDYTNNILPIFKSKCIACHNASLSKTTPTQPDWTDYTTSFSKKDHLFDRVCVARTMPQGGGMTEAERGLVGAWIKGGAPETLATGKRASDDEIKLALAGAAPETKGPGTAPDPNGFAGVFTAATLALPNTRLEQLNKAKTIYAAMCLPCHGACGDGNGASASGMAIKPRNFRVDKFLQGEDDASIVKTLTTGVIIDADGKPKIGSPMFGNDDSVISHDDKMALAQLIREFRAEGPAKADDKNCGSTKPAPAAPAKPEVYE